MCSDRLYSSLSVTFPIPTSLDPTQSVYTDSNRARDELVLLLNKSRTGCEQNQKRCGSKRYHVNGRRFPAKTSSGSDKSRSSFSRVNGVSGTEEIPLTDTPIQRTPPNNGQIISSQKPFLSFRKKTLQGTTVCNGQQCTSLKCPLCEGSTV